MKSKQSSDDEFTIAFLTTLSKKKFPFYSFLSKSLQKGQPLVKPILYTNDTFHTEKYKTFLLNTGFHESLFAEMPQIHMLLKLKRYFSFMDFFSENSEGSCSVLDRNNSAGLFCHCKKVLFWAPERTWHFRTDLNFAQENEH